MEEPQLSNAPNEMNSEETKNDSNEDPQEGNIENDTAESMETEDVPANDLESMSPVDVVMSAESSEQVAVDATVPSDILQEEADGDQPAVVDPVSTLSEEIDAEMTSYSVDCTEKSINISQLDIDHQTADDSTDAFDALKRSESDALQPSNEELEKHQQREDESNSKIPEEDGEEQSSKTSKILDPKSVDTSDGDEDISSHDDVSKNNDEDISCNQEEEDVSQNVANPDLPSNVEEMDTHDDISGPGKCFKDLDLF